MLPELCESATVMISKFDAVVEGVTRVLVAAVEVDVNVSCEDDAVVVGVDENVLVVEDLDVEVEVVDADEVVEVVEEGQPLLVR